MYEFASNASNIIDEFKKFAILEKGIGIESQIYANNLTIKKLCKQDGTQLLL